MCDFIEVRNALTGKTRRVRVPARPKRGRARLPRARSVKVELDVENVAFAEKVEKVTDGGADIG